MWTRAIAKADRLGITSNSLWELSILVEQRRIALDRELLPWIQGALADPRLELLPRTPAVVSTAHQLRGALDGDPGDRVITATALTEGAKLVTRDARITESGLVPTIWWASPPQTPLS